MLTEIRKKFKISPAEMRHMWAIVQGRDCVYGLIYHLAVLLPAKHPIPEHFKRLHDPKVKPFLELLVALASSTSGTALVEAALKTDAVEEFPSRKVGEIHREVSGLPEQWFGGYYSGTTKRMVEALDLLKPLFPGVVAGVEYAFEHKQLEYYVDGPDLSKNRGLPDPGGLLAARVFLAAEKLLKKEAKPTPETPKP